VHEFFLQKLKESNVIAVEMSMESLFRVDIFPFCLKLGRQLTVAFSIVFSREEKRAKWQDLATLGEFTPWLA